MIISEEYKEQIKRLNGKEIEEKANKKGALR